MLKEYAKQVTGGGLSSPGKMNGTAKAYNLPPDHCVVGQALAKLGNEYVCFDCYACKNRYAMEIAQKALYSRLTSLSNPHWVDGMVTLIGNDSYFRWHDAGDLQSMVHFLMILKVVKASPNTLHWLPTREVGIVKAYKGKLPKNLLIRFSAPKIDGKPIKVTGTDYLTSTVHDKAPAIGYQCPAPSFGNNCKQANCTACWDSSVTNVSYSKH